MRCLTCNHDNRDTAKFCEACGAGLVRQCARCHTTLRPGAKFCDECGHSANEASQQRNAGSAAFAAPDSDVIRAPLSYTPKLLVDKILQSRSALEGERKQVTVLFADVKGSMELAEQLGPEEWHAILERFFAILTEGVHRFEGTVNQYRRRHHGLVRRTHCA
jgi:Double zinc ribbon